MTLRRDWIGSPNYSNRNTPVRLIVLHTAEGALSYQSLGSFFANPASGVSSHVGIDDSPSVIGEYVLPHLKAWTQADANPYSVAAELCAFASWTPAQWHTHATMLANTAAWIAEEAIAFDIPIRKLSPAEAQGGVAGVCQHVDLGAAGGNHWDCGPGFPMDEVLHMAANGAWPEPSRQKGHNMIASTDTGRGYWTVTHDGAVYAFGDAQFKGQAFDPDLITGEVIGIAGKGTDGYWLYASDGGIFAFGSADFLGRPDRT
jgi:hypothetical protein